MSTVKTHMSYKSSSAKVALVMIINHHYLLTIINGLSMDYQWIIDGLLMDLMVAVIFKNCSSLVNLRFSLHA